MKKIIISTLFSLFLLFPLMETGAGQTFTKKEHFSETFKVTPNTTIEVNNKYGKIHVVPWNKDSVKFDISLKLSSNSLSRLQKTRKGINFDFTHSKFYITAITDFGNSGNKIFSELKNLSESLIPGSNDIEVNYTVYCPENVKLSVINKFGDIYIDDLRGDISISLSNGNLKMNSISGVAQIELNFGNGIINHISDARLSVSYSDLMIKSAEKLTILSKSSTLTLDDTDLIKLDSRRDRLFMKRTHTLIGKSNFSQLWTELVISEVNLNMKYGNLIIEQISPEFHDITLLTEYGDLNLYLPASAEYQADIYHHKEVNLNIPENGKGFDISHAELNEEESHTWFKTSKKPGLPGIKITAPEKCYINLLIK